MARFEGASFAVLVTVSVFSLQAFAASPPKAGCRPVSKLEYNISKKGERDYQSWWQIHPTRAILRRNYWHCPV